MSRKHEQGEHGGGGGGFGQMVHRASPHHCY
jgi:hypothetical protein